MPTVSVGASASRQREGTYTAAGTRIVSTLQDKTYVGIEVGWEPDVWGGKRAQIESLETLEQAAAARRHGVRLSVTALLAANYLALRQVDAMLVLRQRALQIDRELAAIESSDLRLGRRSADDVLHTGIAVDEDQASLALLQRSRANNEHAIAVLSGRAPADFHLAPTPAPETVPQQVPVSLPAQLLQRRPDIVQAERAMAASNARVGAARTAWFPAISLGAADSANGVSLRHLFDLPWHLWAVGLSLTQTLFDGGRRSAALDAERARHEEQVARYRLTVLTAFQEVEDALSSQQRLRQRDALYRRSLETNRKLAQSQQKRRRLGLASRRDVLVAEREVLLSEMTWRSGISETEQNIVFLIKSLGGGWQSGADGAATVEGQPAQATPR